MNILQEKWKGTYITLVANGFRTLEGITLYCTRK